nr:hypothetical protein REQ54_00810 [Rhizobium sp. Q54]
MSSADLFTDRARERRCDPRLLEILTDRLTAWNEPLAYLLSAVVALGLGFASAVNL